MHIDLKTDFTPKPFPENVTLRTIRPGQDEHAIHALVQRAFDRPGRTPQPFDAWKEFMMRREIFHPELWFLAVVGEEIIGTCLCFQYGQLGWVRQLAVVEKWRRKGLGAALLCHAFQVFKERGYKKVGLVVDSDNPNAYRFYQSLGMKKMRQYDQYLKMIS
jgi:ribosomal protein S18 acetylase RimI-like enzyme